MPFTRNLFIFVGGGRRKRRLNEKEKMANNWIQIDFHGRTQIHI